MCIDIVLCPYPTVQSESHMVYFQIKAIRFSGTRKIGGSSRHDVWHSPYTTKSSVHNRTDMSLTTGSDNIGRTCIDKGVPKCSKKEAGIKQTHHNCTVASAKNLGTFYIRYSFYIKFFLNGKCLVRPRRIVRWVEIIRETSTADRCTLDILTYIWIHMNKMADLSHKYYYQMLTFWTVFFESIATI